MNTPFFRYNEDFHLFGFQHKLMIGLTVLLALLLPFLAKRYLNGRGQLQIARGLSLLISFWVAFWIAIRLWLGDFDHRTDLPLDICNVVALALPLLMWKPSQRVHEILYFWILAGTLQAVLTPHLYDGFPHFTFFKYWFVHGGLIVYAVYITRVFDLYPTTRGLFRSFGLLQLYVLVVLGLNLLLGSNYVYILGKPPTASPLDYLGPWPWYLLVVEALALMMFFLVYLPIGWRKARQPG